MTLTELIGLVMARVATEVPGVTTVIGWRDEDTHGSPPRVDWRPTQHTRDTAYLGGSRADGFLRAILGRAQSFDVRIWGADVDAVESLFDALVRALEAEASGAWSYDGGDWARAESLTLGEAITATITLGAVVLEAPSTLVTITSAGLTPTSTPTPGDGLLELGE